jgi:hypothetical protein
MTLSTRRRRLTNLADLFGQGKHKRPSDQTAQPEHQPGEALGFYFASDKARKALSLLLSNIRKENASHHDRLVHHLETRHWSPLTDYFVQMAFFESVRPPVRPLALPSKVADWLLALPDSSAGYHPEDMCWECGYAYPFSWGTSISDHLNGAEPDNPAGSAAPGSADPTCRNSPWRDSACRDSACRDSACRDSACRDSACRDSACRDSACRDSACRDSACRRILPATFSIMHPWVGQHCLYCGGEIVNHLEWLLPNPKHTLSDFHNAPFRKKRESMESQWCRELNEVQIPHQARLPFLRP